MSVESTPTGLAVDQSADQSEVGRCRQRVTGRRLGGRQKRTELAG